MAKNLEIFIDGSCTGNPGPGKAVVFIDKMDNEFMPQEITLTRDLEQTTNNQAEYYSLLLALDWIENTIEDIKREKIKQITIYTDSKLIAGHMNEDWKINKNTALIMKAKKKLTELRSILKIEIQWLPREENEAGIIIEKGEI